MKQIFTLLLSLSILHPCLAQTTTGSFMYNGVLRDYILHVPPGYSAAEPAPLVLNLHGYTSNAQQQQFYTDFDSDADTAGYIVVYPNGIANAWNSGFNVPYHSGVDDVGFLSALIDTLIAGYAIDECRVFSTGMSNGGFMSYRLACELEDRIAAVASVTGSMTDSMQFYCQNTRAISVMEFHGTADNTVQYNGATGYTSTGGNFNFWEAHNNCLGAAITSDLPDTDPTDGATVTKIYFTTCDDQTELITYKVNGGGHTWPGASLPIGVTTQDIRASSEIIRFFNKNPRCGTSSLNENTKAQLLIYPNPAENTLTIKSEMRGELILNIADLTGKIVYADKNYLNNSPVMLNDLAPGIYYLELSGKEDMLREKFVKR